MQQDTAFDLGGLGAPDLTRSVVRAIEDGQIVCLASAIRWNSQNAPCVLLADVQARICLTQCPADGNKQYCTLANPDGEPGAALGIVYAPAQDMMMVRTVPYCS
jgi:hypothetical protein